MTSVERIVYPYSRRESRLHAKEKGITADDLIEKVCKGEFVLGKVGEDGIVDPHIAVSMRVNNNPIAIGMDVSKSQKFLQKWYERGQRIYANDVTQNERQEWQNQEARPGFSLQLMRAIWTFDFCTQHGLIAQMNEASLRYESADVKKGIFPTQKFLPILKKILGLTSTTPIRMTHEMWAYAHFLYKEEMVERNNQAPSERKPFFEHTQAGFVAFAEKINDSSGGKIKPDLTRLRILPQLFALTEWNWSALETSLETIDVFKSYIQRKEDYQGIPGMVLMANRLGGVSPIALYKLASMVDLLDGLGWPYLHTSYKDIEAMLNPILISYNSKTVTSSFVSAHQGQDGLLRFKSMLNKKGNKITTQSLLQIVQAYEGAEELNWPVVPKRRTRVREIRDTEDEIFIISDSQDPFTDKRINTIVTKLHKKYGFMLEEHGEEKGDVEQEIRLIVLQILAKYTDSVPLAKIYSHSRIALLHVRGIHYGVKRHLFWEYINLQRVFERELRPDEISIYLNIPLEEATFLSKVKKSPLSLQTIESTLDDSFSGIVFQRDISRETRKYLIDKVGEQGAKLVIGIILDEKEEHVIAKELGLSSTGVKQKLTEALRKLQGDEKFRTLLKRYL